MTFCDMKVLDPRTLTRGSRVIKNGYTNTCSAKLVSGANFLTCHNLETWGVY